MTDVLRMIDYAESGNLPAAGGILDQTQSFMDAWDCVRSERVTIAKERNG